MKIIKNEEQEEYLFRKLFEESVKEIYWDIFKTKDFNNLYYNSEFLVFEDPHRNRENIMVISQKEANDSV